MNLDRMLLHSPEVARGWNEFFGALRSDTKLSLNPKFRELAICSIAVLNSAEYEFFQHEKPWRIAGATPEQILAIRKINCHDFDVECFDGIENLVIDLTIQMTNDIKPKQEVLRALKCHMGDKEVVELVAVISGYNMVSRFLVALDITTEGES